MGLISNLFTRDSKPSPYWWEQAPLADSPAAALPGEADVVIIGAGYTGLHAAIQCAREGLATVVLLVGADGAVRSATKATTQLMMGRQVLGMPWTDALPEGLCSVAGLVGHVERAVARRREVTLPRVDVAERSFRVHVVPLEHELARFMLQVEELTDAVAMEARLRRSESLAQLGALSAAVAHELRNPLGSAQLAVDVLRELTIPGVDAPMQLLDASLSRIGGIVDATLADAASERGAPVLQRQRTDLDELVRAIVDEHRPGAVRKQQSLEVDGAAVTLSVDPARIFHAVGNLVSNAIKYSPRGATILVTVGEGEAGARVEIADEGPGVPEDAADELFRPFVRGPAKPTAGERSMGLGLHIARRMVELHDGTIGVRPRSDRPGAAFWFELPR